jgi:hypothetical protein
MHDGGGGGASSGGDAADGDMADEMVADMQRGTAHEGVNLHSVEKPRRPKLLLVEGRPGGGRPIFRIAQNADMKSAIFADNRQQQNA